MIFEYNDKTNELIARLQAFIDEHIVPNEHVVNEWNQAHENMWKTWPGLEGLKAKAREAGLWNLFLPEEYGEYSPGLSNLEYAPLCEMMGRYQYCPEVFNCSAPDTGNMEVLAKYGSEAQKKEWLIPLLNGEIRSCFAMTEPQVASSDATNIETQIVADGDEYVINGRKHWISGAMDERVKMCIVMGKTDTSAPRHQQQSQIIVPSNFQGIEIVRPLPVYGDLHSPMGHCEIRFNNVRVPKENIILGEGRGFEIAQGRLGPGRIHHCMRSIGQAQRSFEAMCERTTQRTTFGRRLDQRSSIRFDVAKSFCDIEQARLLTLKAAYMMDKYGARQSKDLIAAIKIVAPNMACDVIDRAVQVHGGLGVSDDFPMAYAWVTNRFIRIADGPDEVHMYQLGKQKIAEHTQNKKPSAGKKSPASKKTA